MYLISPGAVGSCGVERQGDERSARRVLWLGAAIVLVVAALFAVGSRRVEAAGAVAQTGGSGAATNADFPLTAHVTASFKDMDAPRCTVDVTIDSVKYRMITTMYSTAYIALGDYPARVVLPKKPSKLAAYWKSGVYEFQLPDRTTAEFAAIGQWTD
jgi:hypothetical protein